LLPLLSGTRRFDSSRLQFNKPVGRYWLSHSPHKTAKVGSMPTTGTTIYFY